MKLVIETSEANIRMMLRGMDILMRANMGQLTSFVHEIRGLEFPADKENEVSRLRAFDYLESKLEDLEPIFTGLGHRTYPSISNDQTPETAKALFDLYSAIRYEIDGDSSVYSQLLMPRSKTPVSVDLVEG